MTATLIPNADDQRIAEQLALAKQLRDQSMTDKGGSGMAGNVYMVGNQWGNVARSLGGAAMDVMGNRALKGLEDSRNQQYEDYMKQLPSATTQQTSLGTAPGSQQSQMLADQEGISALPETSIAKPTRQYQQETNDWALNAPNIPQMQALRQAGLAQRLATPEKQAAAEEAAAIRENALKLTMADKQQQREWQAIENEKYKRSFEQAMALHTAPTIHITNGGGGGSEKVPKIMPLGTDSKGNQVAAVDGVPSVWTGSAWAPAASGFGPKDTAAGIDKRAGATAKAEVQQQAYEHGLDHLEGIVKAVKGEDIGLATGVVNSALPKWASTNPQAKTDTVSRITNLQEYLQTKGLEDLRRAGVSPGSVTEREWSKFAARAGNIDPALGKAKFDAELNKLLVDIKASRAGLKSGTLKLDAGGDEEWVRDANGNLVRK